MGGGSGQFIANWILSGKPPYPLLPTIHPARCKEPMDKSECLRRIKTVYSGSYAESSN